MAVYQLTTAKLQRQLDKCDVYSLAEYCRRTQLPSIVRVTKGKHGRRGQYPLFVCLLVCFLFVCVATQQHNMACRFPGQVGI
jgi:hypothetical protein